MLRDSQFDFSLMHCQRIFSWDPHTYEWMDDMATEMFCHCICEKLFGFW